MIEFDEEYMVPINTYTYYFDLLKANKNSEVGPVWVQQHDTLKEYGLSDMSPSSMKKFAEDMEDNEALRN